MAEAQQVRASTEHVINPLIGELNGDLLDAAVFLESNRSLTASSLADILVIDAINEGRTEVDPKYRELDTSDSERRSLFRLGGSNFVILEQSALAQDLETPALLVAVMRQELMTLGRQDSRILRAAALRAAVRKTKIIDRFDPPEIDSDEQ